ncbi:MAG: helix-turn-helix domain-containing protein [Actinophytocola sp.]|nr:helix-turn-helix domain-containing protein [Actinophytocola sp.]
MTAITDRPGVGRHLRDWRLRRGLSQLELASRAGVSARHLSFVETGRSQPTSAMILRLCEQLAIPLREQNGLLLAGGYAPAYPEEPLTGPRLAAVNAAIERILTAHDPFPALVIDRMWDLVTANAAASRLLTATNPGLLEPPVNVIRFSLHPDGLAPRIRNLGEWRSHLLGRRERDVRATGDPALSALLDEARGYGDVEQEPPPPDDASLVVPLRLAAGETELSLVSTTTVFGTPREVTVSELAIEAFYPADEPTRRLLEAASKGEPAAAASLPGT